MGYTRRRLGPRGKMGDRAYLPIGESRPLMEVDRRNDWYYPFTPTGRIKQNYLQIIYSEMTASELAKWDDVEELGGLWDDPIISPLPWLNECTIASTTNGR